LASLFGRLLRTYLLVACLPLGLLGVAWHVEQGQRDRQVVLRQLRSLAGRVRDAMVETGSVPPTERLARWAREQGARLTVIAVDGTVLADTHERPERMENHAQRPEVRAALVAGEGIDQRTSATLGTQLLYLAVAVEGRRRAVVRAALPVAGLAERVWRGRFWLLGGLLAASLLAGAMAARQARRLAEPLDALCIASEQARRERWQTVPRPDGPRELVELCERFNAMIGRLAALLAEREATQAHLETLLAAIPVGLVVLDPRGQIVRFNQAAARLLGLSEAALGRPLIAAVPCYPLDAAARSALARQAAAVEFRAPWPPHAALRVLPTALPAAAGGGALLVIEDHSELRRLDDVRRDFVANVSHQLRTPVSVLLAQAETLERLAGRRPEIVPEYAAQLATEARRLARLIADLLRLSEIEAGRWAVRIESLSVAEALAEVANEFAALARERGVRLDIAVDGEMAVRADRVGLRQVLANLVENALKFTPTGGGVVLRGERKGEEVELIVEDTGAGIPADELPRIFERFYRGRDAADLPGSGLGLAIARHAVEAQGGRLWAESRPGEGSRFVVALPASPAGGGAT